MAQAEDIAAIRAGFAQWNDVGVTTDYMHPEIEWTDPPELPGADTHVGAAATIEFLRGWEGSMGIVSMEFEVEEIRPVGDEYLVISLASGAGAGGAPIPAHYWFHIMRMEDGLIRRVRCYLDRDQAFATARLPTD